MTFMNPLFLLAGLGLSLPVLAHLLNRYQYKETDWAAMQFLNRTVRVRSRQIRLRDLFLLLLRCLALSFLVFALARPAIQSPGDLAGKFGERRAGVIIAIDASFSMQETDGTTTRFQRAVQEAHKIVEDLTPGSPICLVMLGEEHEVIVRNMAYDKVRFAAELDAQQSRPEGLKLETVADKLARLAGGMDAAQREVYVITDLQATNWREPSSGVLDGFKALNRQATTSVVPVTGTANNLAVSEFQLFSGLLRKGTKAKYRATVRNDGNRPVNNVRVRCVMDDVNVDTKVIPYIGSRSSETVSLFVPFQSAGSIRLEAEIQSDALPLTTDALPLDNSRGAVASVRGRVSVLSVERQDASFSRASFVSKALSARGAASGKKEEFKIDPVSWLSLQHKDLSVYDIVVLSDIPEITAAQAKRLRDYVREGNGLIWFGGENVKAAIWNDRAMLKDGPLLPAAIGGIESVSDEIGAGRPLNPILPKHPICRPLQSLPKDLLAETQFHKLHKVRPLPGSSAVLNLSGNATPLLIEQSLGRGQVFMFTSSSDTSWNNMAMTPVFPMLMQQIVTYLTGREFEQSQLVGGALSLSYPYKPDANDGVFRAPSGKEMTVPVREHAGHHVAFLDNARETGFYTAHVSLQAPGHPIAVNVDTRESDIASMAVSDVRRSLKDTGIIVTETPLATLGSYRTAYEYWRALMFACLAFLLIESIWSSQILTRKKAVSGADRMTHDGEGGLA